MAKKSSTLHTKLKRRAAAWAGRLTKVAKALAPNHLQPYISSHVEVVGEGDFIIRLQVNRLANQAEKYGSLDARAQEYGSGLRARRGPKVKIPIFPKEKKYLAFYWEVAAENSENFRFLPDGRVLLASVEHPGIEAANQGKGYLGPAITELKRVAKEQLNDDVHQAIRDIRTSFRGSKK